MNRAEELTLLLADGLASETDACELETLVGGDPAARRACLRLLELEGALRGGIEADAVDATMERLRALLAEQTAGVVLKRVRFREEPHHHSSGEADTSAIPPPAPLPRRLEWLARAAGLAALLGLAAVWFFAPEKSKATLADTRGEVRVVRGSRTFATSIGFKLEAGDRLLAGTNASAAVLFSGETTRIALDAGTELALLSTSPAKQFRLLTGQVDARVSRQPAGHPLILRAPHAVATVLGTEFRLTAEPQQTRLDVREGTVRLARTEGPGGIEVRAGEFAVAAPGLEPVARPFLREAVLWPFAVESPWNHPLGSGAAFAPVRSRAFPPTGPPANIVKHLPLNLAAATDPLRGIVVSGQRIGEIRVPDQAVLDAADALPAVFLVEASHSGFELVRATRQPGGELEADGAQRVDLQGSGFNAQGRGVSTFGVPFVGGLIRRGELIGGIRHALAASVPPGTLNFNGPGRRTSVWPVSKLLPSMATGGDNTSNLQPGSLLALPPSVDIRRLGLGAAGVELGRAMQDYGVYIAQVGGEPFNLFAEDGAAPSATELDAALGRLLPLLQLVTNNTPENSGGGGMPRRPRAPMFLGPREP